MKNLVEKLKGLDYKQLAVAHAEKLGAGVVLLLILLVLGSSRFRSYPKTPKELADAAEQARTRIEAADWPEEKVAEYRPIDYLSDSERGVKRLHTTLEVAAYRYSIPLSWPLYRKRQRIKEPAYRAPEDMIATSGRAILRQRNPELNSLELAEADSTEDATSTEPEIDEFSPRGQLAGGPGSAASGTKNQVVDMQGLLAMLPGMLGDEAGLGDLFGTSGGSGGYSISCEYAAAAGSSGYGALGGLVSYGAIGQGARYVAVRGIVNLQKQKEEIARAIGEPVSHDIGNMVEIVDFEMQRQRAVAGPDPWGGPWEPVDLEVALDYLEKADSWEVEPIDIGVTDPVITMPLPSRVAGFWGPRASHPRVKNFQLTPEELSKEVKLNQKILEQYNKIKAELPPPTVERKGFSSQVNNLRQMREQVFLNKEGNFNLANIITEISKGDEKRSDPKRRKQIEQEIQARVDASGRLLLYRYFDFNVEPGNAYRYRVKLNYRNPFYRLPPNRVYDPHVAEGQLRETDWSEPTAPVLVNDDTSYFVAESSVLSGRMRDGVQMEVFEWNSDTGTTIHDQWWMKPGQFVGGRRKTDLLRPTELTFDTEDVEFASNDYLVDTLKPPLLEKPADHPDLKLPADAKGSLGIPDRAVVMNQYGELVPLDSASNSTQRTLAQTRLEAERRDWQYLKEVDATADSSGAAPLALGNISQMLKNNPDAKKMISKFMKVNKIPEPLRKQAEKLGIR